MLHSSINKTNPKGWFYGPWNSELPIPVGYANEGIPVKHLHNQMFEVYLVAQGHSIAEVNGVQITLKAGDVLVVEPGEVHTFSASSPDYLHFVIQTPFVPDDKVVIQE